MKINKIYSRTKLFKKMSLNLKMALLIMEAGVEMSNMVMVFKFGLMERSIKGIGSIMKLMVKVNSPIPMGMFIKVIGKMVKQMVMEYLSIIQVADMKVIGKMIYNMGSGLKPGLMVTSTKVNINTGKKMEKVYTIGMTEAIIEVIG